MGDERDSDLRLEKVRLSGPGKDFDMEFRVDSSSIEETGESKDHNIGPMGTGSRKSSTEGVSKNFCEAGSISSRGTVAVGLSSHLPDRMLRAHAERFLRYKC